MRSKSAPFWIFDLSQLNGNEDIQSIQFKGNLPIGGWFAVYFSVSSSVGQLSTTIASELWNGGHWSYGDGQYSGFSWPMGDFSQNLSLDIILPGIISGQLNILAYVSSWNSIDNTGDNAPRLVIEYEPEIVPILGDVNSDNIVNVLDLIEIVNLILNNNEIYIEIADMNFDGKINLEEKMPFAVNGNFNNISLNTILNQLDIAQWNRPSLKISSDKFFDCATE